MTAIVKEQPYTFFKFRFFEKYTRWQVLYHYAV